MALVEGILETLHPCKWSVLLPLLGLNTRCWLWSLGFSVPNETGNTLSLVPPLRPSDGWLTPVPVSMCFPQGAVVHPAFALFDEVSGFPGRVAGGSLPLLAALTLLQEVFVFGGCVHVPLFQRLRHWVPQPPRLHQTLPLHWPDLLLDDWQFGSVNHFGLATAVGELQCPIPLPLCFAHNGIGGVVFDLCCHPVHFPSVEGLGVECDGGGVATLGTVDGDFTPQLHPGHSEDGAGVGTGQREDVLLIVLQKA